MPSTESLSTASPEGDVSPAKWPDALPKPEEEHIASIVCGNSHLHWAFHSGLGDELSPALFWRTPPLDETDVQGSMVDALSRHLPQFAHDFIFGPSEEPSTKAAENAASQRAVPVLRVYLISTNGDQVGRLQRLWSCVPSKLWKLSGEDFFSKAQGRYDTMGVDRLACLRGALELHGAPALVFDGGTATTYTASDASGNIMGGGIGPGLAAKFNAMVDTTSDLPELSPGMIEAACNRIVLSKTPLSTFSDNTEDAMLVDVLGEFAYKSRTIIHQWLSKTKTASKTKAANKKKKDTKPDKVNNERMILVTGGDGEIYSKLLEPDHSKIVEMEPNGSPTGPRVSDAWSYKVMHTKHLIHYGIKAALLAQVELHSQREATIQQEKDNKLFMGLRVVKMFDGEPYGGTVTSIVRADDIEEELFDIHYDDDDSDQNTPSELYALLMLYYEKGEPGGVKGNADQNKKKREASKAAAEELKKRGYYSPVVAAPKKTSEKTTDSSTSTATAAVVAIADTVPPKIQTKTTTPAVSPSKSVEVPKRPAAMADLATSVTSAKKSKTKKVYAFQKKANPKDYLNDRVAKVFDDRKTYFGTIKEYSSDADGNLWRIFYDDGDTEDYDEHDIKASIILYEQKKKNDPEHKYRNYAATPSSQMTPPQVPKKKDGGSKAK